MGLVAHSVARAERFGALSQFCTIDHNHWFISQIFNRDFSAHRTETNTSYVMTIQSAIMSTSPMRAPREASFGLVCRPSEEACRDAEVTFYEPDRDPDERTTRWITADAADCIPESEWR